MRHTKDPQSVYHIEGDPLPTTSEHPQQHGWVYAHHFRALNTFFLSRKPPQTPAATMAGFMLAGRVAPEPYECLRLRAALLFHSGLATPEPQAACERRVVDTELPPAETETS